MTNHESKLYLAEQLPERIKMERKPCEVCNDVNSEAHHDDYSKPMEVRFLCSKHHKEHHAKQ